MGWPITPKYISLPRKLSAMAAIPSPENSTAREFVAVLTMDACEIPTGLRRQRFDEQRNLKRPGRAPFGCAGRPRN